MTVVLLPWRPRERARSSAIPRWVPLRGSHFALLRMWWRRHRSRVSLSMLDSRMLKDIGITRADAEYEANKPFWLP